MAKSAVDSMWQRGSGRSSGGFAATAGKIPSRPIPPSGTSAYKAYEKTMREGTGVPQTIKERLTGTFNYPAKSTVSKLVDTVSSSPSSKRKRGSSGGSYGGSSGGSYDGSGAPIVTSANEAFNYYEAPIAEKYGFSKTTAYQEALANTAYRREMEDMRKAGLNPSVIYGSHNTSGADSGIIPRDDFAPISYGGSGRSGGYGGSGRRSRGGNSGKYVFSGGAYYGIMAGVGAVTALATHNVGAGMAAAGLAGTAMKALNGFLKK